MFKKIMKENKNNTVIPITLLFGCAFGNVVGIFIGLLFTECNLGIGLLIGNAVGIILGLICGCMIDYIRKNKE